jgi:branched-chain amino acid transport system permease protein
VRATLRFLVLTALGLIVFPFLIHPIGGYAGLATQIVIVAIASVGFNLLLGEAGMLSYGQAMFYGGGGYVTAILLLRVMPDHPNLWLAVLGATLATAIIAGVIGMLVVRVYGIYFALLTLAFAQMMFFIVEQAKDWTNGDDGLQSIPDAPLWFGPWSIDLQNQLPSHDLGIFGNLSEVHLWYPFGALVLLLVLWLVRTLNASQFGEVLAAIRENEERSAFVGFVPQLYRFAAFVVAGALAGLAGSLRAIYDGTVAVESVGIDRSGSFVIYTIVGGVQTLFGPVVGTGVIMYLENVLSAQTGAWRLIEGVIFVLAIVFLPGGIVGTLRKHGTKKGRGAIAKSLAARTGAP